MLAHSSHKPCWFSLIRCGFYFLEMGQEKGIDISEEEWEILWLEIAFQFFQVPIRDTKDFSQGMRAKEQLDKEHSNNNHPNNQMWYTLHFVEFFPWALFHLLSTQDSYSEIRSGLISFPNEESRALTRSTSTTTHGLPRAPRGVDADPLTHFALRATPWFST